jgi:transcriptional regulator with XRE-family HTH domain
MNNRIASIFKQYNLTQQEVSEKLGVSKASISHLLSGRNKPSLDLIIAIHKNFQEIELEWLLTGKGNKLVTKDMEKASSVQKIDIESELGKLEYSIELTQRELLFQLQQIREKFKKY